jgi:phytoene desaturase
MNKSVIVIGAGLGGLAAAIRLAKLGFKVTIYEKNSRPGGKMNEKTLAGFRFDTGPSLLTMPEVIEDLFQFCGLDVADYLKLIKIEPTCRYFFDDDTSIDTYTDFDKMLNILREKSADQEANYKNFLTYVSKLYNYAAEIFLYTPIHELKLVARKITIKDLLKLGKLDAFSTVHKRTMTYFNDPRLVQIFDRFATYNGSDPFQAPATLNIIAHVELNQGGYYIRGGMYRLVDSLVNLCKELKVEINYNSPVTKILSEQQLTTGVRVNGEKIESDFVICNVDVVNAYEQLIDGFEHRKKKLKKLEPSLSGMVFLWGIKGNFDQLSQHNIFFSRDYRQEFQQLFGNKAAPNDPTVYIAITSREDPDHAPQNHENWFVLINMPYLNEGQDWKTVVPQMRKAIIERLMKVGVDVSNSIVHEEVLTPLDFMKIYNANRGSIYGISSNKQFSAFLRPPNRSRELKNLFFVGGSTHPGGGIPLVLLSAKLVSEMIISKLKN